MTVSTAVTTTAAAPSPLVCHVRHHHHHRRRRRTTPKPLLRCFARQADHACHPHHHHRWGACTHVLALCNPPPPLLPRFVCTNPTLIRPPHHGCSHRPNHDPLTTTEKGPAGTCTVRPACRSCALELADQSTTPPPRRVINVTPKKVVGVRICLLTHTPGIPRWLVVTSGTPCGLN